MMTPAEAGSFMAEFAVPFASTLVKLRDADRADTGAALEQAEVKALMEGLRLLNHPGDPK